MTFEQKQILEYILMRLVSVDVPDEHYWGLSIIADRLIMNHCTEWLPELKDDTECAET